ncbi:MAG: LamG-like jellyroll fold domain-containing protein [Myxococcota bacterium]
MRSRTRALVVGCALATNPACSFGGASADAATEGGSTTEGTGGDDVMTTATPGGPGNPADGNPDDSDPADSDADTSDDMATTGEPSPGGWLEGYQFRRAITIHPSTDLDEFPVGISLRDDEELEANAAENGRDIRFTEADGETLVPFEIEAYSGGNLAAWVDAGPLSGDRDTVVFLYYGLGDARMPPAGADVWAERFVGVWHMVPTNTELADATGNGKVGAATSEDQAAAPGSGIMGRAAAFDGVDDLYTVADPGAPSLDFGDQSFSYSLWVLVDEHTGLFDQPIGKGGADATNPGYGIFLGQQDWTAAVADTTSGFTGAVFGDSADFLGEWTYLAIAVDREAGRLRAYVNGNEVTDSAFTLDDVTASQPLVFSLQMNPFIGVLDEVRIQAAAIDGPRAAAAYRNLALPDEFYSVGDPQAIPSP